MGRMGWRKPRSFFGATIIGENVFIMGGFVNINCRANIKVKSNVSIYNVRNKTWRKGPDMVRGRRSFSACVSTGNTFYVIGGYDEIRHLSSVEMLKCNESGDPIGGWILLPPANVDLDFSKGAVAVDDKIYAFDNSHTPLMYMYDPALNLWKLCGSMSQRRFEPIIAAYNRKVYVFDANGDCERYNPATDSWEPIAQFTERSSDRGSAVLGSKIYFVGGPYCQTTDIYDFETDTWSEGPQLPQAIGRTECVAWS